MIVRYLIRNSFVTCIIYYDSYEIVLQKIISHLYFQLQKTTGYGEDQFCIFVTACDLIYNFLGLNTQEKEYKTENKIINTTAPFCSVKK